MTSETPDPKVTPICAWEFDNYSSKHWEEQKAGVIDATKSYVQLSDVDEGFGNQRLEIVLDKETKMVIDADRDQWGTWITFRIGDKAFTVAQEDETMSFVDAMIAALTKFKDITDIATTPPKLVEYDFKK